MSDSQASVESKQTRNLRGGQARASSLLSGIEDRDQNGADVSPGADVESASHPSGPPEVSKDDLSREDLTGLSLRQYALGRKIGAGGMGTVFVARHVRLGKQFAIKFIATDVAGISEAQARFDQEVLALGKLRHPNIVDAVDAGCLNGVKYLVTELVDGKDFDRLVEQHRTIPIASACELIRQTALGLAHSHRSGFLHRDIKPSNLILDRSGVVKILDFGLARDASIKCRLTEDGRLLGTLDFMPPEQAQNANRVDERGDIYSLGCTLLYLLSGQPPFGDARYSSMAAKLKGHLFDRPEWLSRVPPSIPKKLTTLVERMMAKSPSERIQTAQEVADELVPFASNAKTPALADADQPRMKPVRVRPRIEASSGVKRHWSRSWRLRSLAAVSCICLLAFCFTGTVEQLQRMAEHSREKNPSVQPPLAKARAVQSPVVQTPVVQSPVAPSPFAQTKEPEADVPPQIISFQEGVHPMSGKSSRRQNQVRIQNW